MFALIGHRAAKINLFGYISGILILLCSTVISQEPTDSFAQDEQTFVEIELTPEGVIAFDSAGNPWNWDFNTELFKPGRGSWVVSRGGERITENPTNALSVELRATNEKFIDESHKRVVVEFDEYVDGDITTSGSVIVRGWVKGNIRSYSRVLVTGSGRVDGNIRAPKVTVKDDGLVHGRIVESDLFTDIPDAFSETVSTAGLWVLFGFALFLTMTGSLIIALMPLKLQRLTDCVTHFAARSFFVGLLFTLLMPMVIGLVVVTVVGILVVWAIPFVYLAAFIIGIVIVGRETGNQLLWRLSRRKGTDILAYLIGLATIMILWLVVAVLMGSSDDVSFGFGVFFLVAAILVSCYPIMTGVGAAFLTRFGFRDYVQQKKQIDAVGREAAAPAPPPIPNGHPGFDQRQSDENSKTSDSGPVPPPFNVPPAIFPPRSDQNDSSD